jgi:hypothetical protein
VSIADVLNSDAQLLFMLQGQANLSLFLEAERSGASSHWIDIGFHANYRKHLLPYSRGS